MYVYRPERVIIVCPNEQYPGHELCREPDLTRMSCTVLRTQPVVKYFVAATSSHMIEPMGQVRVFVFSNSHIIAIRVLCTR